MSNSIEPVDIEFLLKNTNFTKEIAKMNAEIAGVGDNAKLAGDKISTGLGQPLTDTGEKFKKSGAGVGQFTRNLNGLSFSMQQVARELPSLAISPQLFFLAISNNLPILRDNIERVREQNKLLAASGQATVPVFRQLVSSLFSWNTSLIAGITIFTLYGGDIIKFIGGLFKARKEIHLTTEEIKAMNESFAKTAGNDLGKLKALFDTLTNAQKGTRSYYDAKKEIIDQYGKYLNGMDSEIRSLNNLKGAYRALSAEIIKNAKDKALIETNGKLGDDFVANSAAQLDKLESNFITKFGKNVGKMRFQILKNQLEAGKDIDYEMQRYIAEFDAKKRDVVGTSSSGAVQYGSEYDFNIVTNLIKEYKKAVTEFDQKTKEAYDRFGTSNNSEIKTTVQVIEDQINALKNEQKQVSENKTHYDRYQKRINELEKQKEAITGKNEKDSKKELTAYEKLEEKIKKASDAVINASEKERPAMQEKLAALVKEKQAWDDLIKAQRGETKGLKPLPVSAKVSTGKEQVAEQLKPMKQLAEEQRKQLELKSKLLSEDAAYAENWEKLKPIVQEISAELSMMIDKYAEQLGLSEDQAQVMKSVGGYARGIAQFASGNVIGGAFSIITSTLDLLIKTPEKLSENFEQVNERIAKVIDSLNIAEQSLANMGKDGSLLSLRIVKSELLTLADDAKALNEELSKSSTGRRRNENLYLPAQDLVKQAVDLNAEIDKLSNRLLQGDISDDQRKAIQAVLDSYNELIDQIDATVQGITGTTVADLSKGLADAFLSGEDAAEAWGQKVDDLIKNVISRQLTAQLLTKPITDAVNTLVNDTGNGLTTEEAAKFKQTMDDLYASTAPAFAAVQQALKTAGFNFGASGSTAIKGISANVTEDTMSAFIGMLTAVRVDIKDILKQVAAGQDDASKTLLYMKQIADNTSYNKELLPISGKLDSIEKVLKERL